MTALTDQVFTKEYLGTAVYEEMLADTTPSSVITIEPQTKGV